MKSEDEIIKLKEKIREEFPKNGWEIDNKASINIETLEVKDEIESDSKHLNVKVHTTNEISPTIKLLNWILES